jgi:hypothetical protein
VRRSLQRSSISQPEGPGPLPWAAEPGCRPQKPWVTALLLETAPGGGYVGCRDLSLASGWTDARTRRPPYATLPPLAEGAPATKEPGGWGVPTNGT